LCGTSALRQTQIPWPVLKPQIFAAIMDFFATNQPVVDFEKEKELQAKEGNPSDEVPQDVFSVPAGFDSAPFTRTCRVKWCR
jgi:hypothetical protein